MSGIALILAGHGSHVSANTAGIVWDYVDHLRRLGVADEITACFWKEPPAFSQVLEAVESDDVVIVPIFTAQGYFTGEVLPTEMGLESSLTIRGGVRIHLTPTIGEHPLLESVVETRLREMINRHGLAPRETAAAIIGHGTRRNRRSRDTARHQADRIRGLNWLNEVVDVYLDDEPDIPSVYQLTSSPNIIALPYFLAEGSHVTCDVPRALGISGGRPSARVNDRTVYYCEPVGADETICQVILELARDTGLEFEAEVCASAWSAFPAAGRRTLMEALETERMLGFGQIRVCPERVWHSDDSGQSCVIDSPRQLRRILRERPFRPLPTSMDLPGGWHVDLEHPEQAHAVIETVYPGLMADWAAQKREELKTESLLRIGKRQNGMFKNIHNLPRNVIQKAIDSVCGNCIRQPSWWSDLGKAGTGLPCRSACNLWLSTARQMGDPTA